MDRLMICDKLLRLNLSAFHLHGTCFSQFRHVDVNSFTCSYKALCCKKTVWALTKDKDIESLGLRWIEMRTGNGDT